MGSACDELRKRLFRRGAVTDSMSVSVQNAILCVDIGGTSTKAGCVYPNAEVKHVDSIPTKPDVESFLDSLTGLITQTQARASRESAEALKHLGVAVAGFLDPDRGYLVYNSNLAWLEGFPLRARLEERFPTATIEIEVDSNAATMAEYQCGSGQGSKRFLCVTAGTGLGVGMAVDGVPLRFAYGCLGDIGHTVVMRNGPLCTCGGRGCAEALLSSNTLARNYQRLAGIEGEVTLRTVIEGAGKGDDAAISVLAEAGDWLGVAVSSMANTFFPDHIAIAGGLSAAGDFVMKSAEKTFRETACVLARSTATFARAELGSAATLIGAAWPFWQGEAK